MDTDRFRRVEALFNGANVLPPEQRGQYLRDHCGEADLRAEVEVLLAADSTPLPGPATAALGAARAAARDDATDSQVGRVLGAWRLLAPLGSGGMGQVYLAARNDGAYQTRSALKLLNPWLRGSAFEARFAQERQILSDLHHRSIAALLDGGTSSDGVSYLVMELVDGVPITQYADDHGLDVPQRLRLFVQVCHAVQHAHQNLVIHRDLKPGNILVDTAGIPKLLDFGIAKLQGERGQSDPDAPQTQLWTPEYASPEQVRAQPVSTASDVWSLGVILYQLLVGARPGFDPDQPTRPPSRPSLACATGRAPRLRRQLRGDLDTVVLKALAFDPARRYATVQQFGDDIERVLRQEPVKARPDALPYRARMFVRRHRLGVAVATLLLLLILCSTFAIAWLALDLRDERDRSTAAQLAAEQEARAASRVAEFLARLFDGANPNQATGAPPTLRDVLDHGARDAATQLKDDPEVQARLLVLMADAYRQLGEHGAGIAVAEQALALNRARQPTDPLALAASLDSLGELRRSNGQYAAAETLHREALAMRQVQSPPDPVLLGRSLNNLGLTLSEAGRPAEALPLYQQSLLLRRQALGNAAPPVLASVVNLGLLKRSLGDLAGAEADFREVYQARLAALGEVHVGTANVLTHLGVTVLMRGDADAAQLLLERALASRRALLGPRSADVSIALFELAGALQFKGELVRAETLLREARGIDALVFGPDNAETTYVANRLAEVLLARGEFDEAEQLLRDSLRLCRAHLAVDHPRVATTLSSLADVLRARGRDAQALPLYQEALDIQRRKLRPGHGELARTLVGLADLAQRRGEHAQAQVFSDEASTILATAPALFDAQRRALTALRQRQ